ncbi:MAG: hypothetical protein WC564_02800 [Patescibacteria group bacterium]
MNIVVDFSSISEFFSGTPESILWRFMAYYGWMIIAFMFLFFAREVWLLRVQGRFASNVKYMFLAVDIPRGNEQSPRAVENLLTYLGGAHGTINFFERWWEGKFQVSFSFEIVSIDGYTQFIIRTPVDFRNLIESAIYSQYPDAEISEIDDYTEGVPTKFPSEEYDVWGAEFIQVTSQMFPIKLYEEFEHKMGPDETYYKDPMASLMDLCSSLQRGEQLWFQILIVPTDFDWVKGADAEVDKIVGKKPKVSFVNGIIDSAVDVIGQISEFIYSLWGDVEVKEKEFKPLSMVELKPKQKKQIEALHEKISKLGFLAKLRMVYVAKKEVFNPKKVASGFVGYIKQFTALDLNSFKPDMKYTATSTAYFSKVKRLNQRKTNIVNNYINRDVGAGRNPGIYNIAELASVWHFPLEATTKAPLIQKAPMKKGKPPLSLPTEENMAVFQESLEPIYSLDEKKSSNNDNQKEFVESLPSNEPSGPPNNLPFG